MACGVQFEGMKPVLAALVLLASTAFATGEVTTEETAGKVTVKLDGKLYT